MNKQAIPPLFNFDGRLALVTGADQGMGQGVQRAVCRQGVRVVINDHCPKRAGSDILVNNAGVPPGMPNLLRPFKDLADDDVERQLVLKLHVGRAGTPDDVGAAVAYLESTEASWMSRQVLALNGGS